MSRRIVISFFVLTISVILCSSTMIKEKASDLRAGIVGCDTSYVIAFTDI